MYASVIPNFILPLPYTLAAFPLIALWLYIFILSIECVANVAILHGKWTTMSKIWYLSETDVTICLMDGLLC